MNEIPDPFAQSTESQTLGRAVPSIYRSSHAVSQELDSSRNADQEVLLGKSATIVAILPLLPNCAEIRMTALFRFVDFGSVFRD